MLALLIMIIVGFETLFRVDANRIISSSLHNVNPVFGSPTPLETVAVIYLAFLNIDSPRLSLSSFSIFRALPAIIAIAIACNPEITK